MRNYDLNPMTEDEVRALLKECSGCAVLNEFNRPAVERMVARGELRLVTRHETYGRRRGGREFLRTITEIYNA